MSRNVFSCSFWSRVGLPIFILTAVGGTATFALAGGGGPQVPTLGEIGKTVEGGVQHLGDVSADVITLGENGRRRDRERAEQEAALAAQERENVERQRQQKILALKDQIALLEGVSKYNVANNTLADEIWNAHNLIVFLGTEELERRKRAFAWIEKLRESNRKSQSDLTLLAEVLSSLKILDNQLTTAAQSKDRALTDTARNERDTALRVTKQIVDTAKTEGSTAASHLDTAIESLKTDSLSTLVKTSLAARETVANLRIQLQTQLTETNTLLEGKKSELKQLSPA